MLKLNNQRFYCLLFFSDYRKIRIREQIIKKIILKEITLSAENLLLEKYKRVILIVIIESNPVKCYFFRFNQK